MTVMRVNTLIRLVNGESDTENIQENDPKSKNDSENRSSEFAQQLRMWSIKHNITLNG